jgi:hypothetical protein
MGRGRLRETKCVVMALLYVAGLAACESSSDPVATPTPSTEAPKSATVAPAPSRPSGLPSTAVAAEESGRLVVVNVATGEVLRILRTFSDLRTVAPEGGHAFPRDITLAPDGTIAYLDWCCEPAAGDIRRIPTAGGDGAGADSVAHGDGPSVSPNGASVAWGTYMSGITGDQGDPGGPAALVIRGYFGLRTCSANIDRFHGAPHLQWRPATGYTRTGRQAMGSRSRDRPRDEALVRSSAHTQTPRLNLM